MAKVDRLIDDVGKQDDKVTTLRDAMFLVKGALWVMGVIGLFVIPLATWLLNRSFPPTTATYQPSAVQAAAVQPAQQPANVVPVK